MYDSARDFINDLRSLREWEERRDGQLELLRNLRYIRYQKVKSPLDYDIVGYKNNEPIRSIKSHSTITTDKRWETIDRIDKEIARVKRLLKRCRQRIIKINNGLDKLDPKLRSMCIAIYVKGRRYEDVAFDVGMSRTSLYRYVREGLKIFDIFDKN